MYDCVAPAQYAHALAHNEAGTIHVTFKGPDEIGEATPLFAPTYQRDILAPADYPCSAAAMHNI
jgi:hypothetical protein